MSSGQAVGVDDLFFFSCKSSLHCHPCTVGTLILLKKYTRVDRKILSVAFERRILYVVSGALDVGQNNRGSLQSVLWGGLGGRSAKPGNQEE